MAIWQRLKGHQHCQADSATMPSRVCSTQPCCRACSTIWLAIRCLVAAQGAPGCRQCGRGEQDGAGVGALWVGRCPLHTHTAALENRCELVLMAKSQEPKDVRVLLHSLREVRLLYCAFPSALSSRSPHGLSLCLVRCPAVALALAVPQPWVSPPLPCLALAALCVVKPTRLLLCAEGASSWCL